MSPHKENMKPLRTIYLALTSGVAMIFAIMVFLIKDEMHSDGKSFYFIVACCVVLSAIFISDKLFKAGLSKAAQNVSWKELDAFEDYRTKKIMQWTLIEGSTLVSLILMFLDKNFLIAAPAFAGLVMLIFSHAREEEFNDHYHISESLY